MAVRNFVRIFQQGQGWPGPSAPAEGSTCSAKGPVVAAFSSAGPSASFPGRLPRVSSKARERARPPLSAAGPVRDGRAGSSSGNAPESHLACTLGKQLQKSQRLAALGDACYTQSPRPLSAGCTSHPALRPGGWSAGWLWDPPPTALLGEPAGRLGWEAGAGQAPPVTPSQWPRDHRRVLCGPHFPHP